MILSSILPFLLIIICGFAASVHGIVGIGFPLIATPLLAMITDMRTAILILVIPTIVLNIANIIKGGAWNKSISIYWPLAFYGALGSFLGTQLLILVPSETFRPLLAGTILLYLSAERVRIGFNWVTHHPRIAMAVFGVSAGLLGGTVNVMLPALVIFSLESKMEKTVAIQVSNFCFLFGKVIQGAVLIHAGLFSLNIISISVPIAILSLSVMFAGMSLRSRLNENVYRRWLRKLLLVMAVVLLSQSLSGLFHAK